MSHTNPTIAAISTAMNTSGIGIVRVSGPEAVEVVSRVYRSPGGRKDLNQVPTHTIHYGTIRDGETVVDEVLVMLMRGPRTYTGEDTVEIDCHGGVLAMRRVLQTVLKNGAVLAEPGEFTKRAFLSGRMDLSQAEAVMDLIQSKNESSMKNSLRQLRGDLGAAIRGVREKLLYEIAFIESALDDPEHISLEGYPEELREKITALRQETDRLLSTCGQGRLMQEGVNTVILGKPNAGKSSLLNRLLGQERAIVTDIAGTTRDTLEEYLNLGGVTLRLTDTAGIRRTGDVVEQIGVERARQRALEADLILYVADSTTRLDQDDREILKMLEGRPAIILYNKTDQPSQTELSELISLGGGHPVLPVSILENEGVGALEEEIRSMFFAGQVKTGEELIITSERHRELLARSVEALDQVLASIEAGLPEDFFTIDMMTAYESLGRILGEEVGEDVVEEIFSRFCVGK